MKEFRKQAEGFLWTQKFSMLASGLHFSSLQPENVSHQITTSSRNSEILPKLFGTYLHAVSL